MRNKLLLILIIIVSIFLISGCANKKEVKKENIENEKDIYINYVQKLKKIKKSS